MKSKKIILIGMMGSGKTSVGALLSNKLNFKFLDCDEIFESQNKILIKNFFSKYGEELFREKETEILVEALKKENIVLSTGGGVILKKKNRDLIFSESNTVVYLSASLVELNKRLLFDNARPLLQTNDIQFKLETILKQRDKFYNLAQLKINTDNKSIEDVVLEILDSL